MRTRIKICCISSIAEAKMAIRHGADAIGLVGKMPSGPGPIPDELIGTIATIIPPPLASFLLTSEQLSLTVIEHLQRTRCNTVQLVDELRDQNYAAIRQALPQVKIVQVIHVSGKESVDEAIRLQKQVDAFLLDSGDPKAAVKTLGGTGNTHNWDTSAELVNKVTIPVFLAGGLHAGNVKAAIEKVRPFGVDICSGVRTNGKLDEDKLRQFISAVNAC